MNMMCYTEKSGAELVAYVNAVNLVNALAPKVIEHYQNLLKSFEGKKVFNAQGRFIKKVQEVIDANPLPELPKNVRIIWKMDYKTKRIELSANCPIEGKDSCVYFHNSFEIVEAADDDTIKGFNEQKWVHQLRQYTVEEILNAQKEANEMLQKVSETIKPYYYFMVIR
jgi:hypothetical protein